MTMLAGSEGYEQTSLYFRLHQLWGDYILFANEGGGKSSWCSRPGRNCLSCYDSIVGDEDDDEKCAVRMVNSDMAAAVTRLAKLVEAEWGNSKFI